MDDRGTMPIPYETFKKGIREYQEQLKNGTLPVIYVSTPKPVEDSFFHKIWRSSPQLSRKDHSFYVNDVGMEPMEDHHFVVEYLNTFTKESN